MTNKSILRGGDLAGVEGEWEGRRLGPAAGDFAGIGAVVESTWISSMLLLVPKKMRRTKRLFNVNLSPTTNAN